MNHNLSRTLAAERFPNLYHRMRLFILGCLISLSICSGCASVKLDEEKSAKELAEDGTNEFNSGKYEVAIKSFEKIKDWYPFSEFTTLAELKIADAHFMLKEYEEAAFAYEEFEKLHPSNKAIPYVVHQIGLCHFRRIDTIDRDQGTALKALNTFRRLKKLFPENEYAGEAEDNIRQCIKSLTGHELYVGLFYFKSKHYKAALNRFKGIIADYPDAGFHQNALQYIALCETSITEQMSEKEKKNPG